MARPKYDWPNDLRLQALLDEHGILETARQVGCPPSSLSSRIRKRGLRGSTERTNPDAANGNGRPDAANAKAESEASELSEESVGEPKPSEGKPTEESIRERKPAEESVHEPTVAGGDAASKRDGGDWKTHKPDEKRRSQMQESLEHLGIADYLLRRPAGPGAVQARSRNGGTAGQGSGDRPNVERSQGDQAAGVETATDPTSSAQHGSGQPATQPTPRGRALLRRVPRALGRVPAPIWRSLAVVALAALAGLAAFISAGNDPKTYQRESSFAVRPSATVPPAAVNDVIGTLAQPDSAITETIVNMLGSPRLRSFAAKSAGLPPSSVGGSGAQYVWSATRRPGSTIIDVRLTGADDDKLLAMQAAASREAARLVEESYTPYRLETLSAPTPPMQVAAKVARTVGLALLLGALVGIMLVLLERKLRSSLGGPEPAGASAQRSESWER